MSRSLASLSSAALLVSLAGLSAAPASAQALAVEKVTGGFSNPVLLTAPAGDDRLFVVEQNTGLIRIYVNGQILPLAYLNLSAKISTGGERGLLGLAFHPDYANNGRLFVNYTRGNGNTVVAEHRVDPNNPNRALKKTVQTILTLVQPFVNHNGGCIRFGLDGMLYIATGDGGSGNDPGGRAQNLTNNLGKMLRLDIDLPAPFIPGDNPFVGDPNANDEIWAYGLRNPWRFSFDRSTGDLWIGDVGQNAREEIDFAPFASTGGENYGWRCMEGFQCTGLSGCTCNDAALTLPIHDYGHGGNCSVTGGHVYRGAIPGLGGTYFFADFCSSSIWSLRWDGNNISEFTDRTVELEPPGADTIDQIASFGEDSKGNIYILDHADGELYRIVEDCSSENFCQTAPNSAGAGSSISESGSLSLSDNTWVLHTTGSVPNAFGMFYYGSGATQVPGGDGFRCVTGSLTRILPAMMNDGAGNASRAVDFAMPPFNGGAGQIFAGTSYSFQHWYRDPAGPKGTGYNFSDGLQVTFCP